MYKLIIPPHIQDMLQSHAPIVALESTIFAHGMPYPKNIETAQRLNKTIRKEGAEPVTIGVLNGNIIIGLTDDEIEHLSTDKNCLKLSRADVAYAIVEGKNGATTVASTMLFANLAGINVFATGGIGGVHRGAEQNFDISADLSEFEKTPVLTVAAGVKAILDIPKTLERLETLGVPVFTYMSDNFPAFWYQNSGFASPLRADSADQIARIWQTQQKLCPTQGMLIANPVPKEAEISGDIIEPIIEKALEEASSQGISGKQITPYLLSRIVELTDGRSLDTNIELVDNNAMLAAKIAVALSKLQE